MKGNSAATTIPCRGHLMRVQGNSGLVSRAAQSLTIIAQLGRQARRQPQCSRSRPRPARPGAACALDGVRAGKVTAWEPSARPSITGPGGVPAPACATGGCPWGAATPSPARATWPAVACDLRGPCPVQARARGSVLGVVRSDFTCSRADGAAFDIAWKTLTENGLRYVFRYNHV